MALTENSRYSPRTKHTALRFNLLVEPQKRGTITAIHKISKVKLADTFIKYLGVVAFGDIMEKIKEYR